MDTLVLNSDYSVNSIVPLSVVHWQEAFRLVCLGKARVLKYHEDRIISTAHSTFKVPSIIVLSTYMRKPRPARKNRQNIFLRDRFQCQICGKIFDSRELTIDHVVPKSLGGGHDWENLSAACMRCNSTKGNNLAIKPRTIPFEPSYFDLVKIRKSMPVKVKDMEWNNFLKWPENLVILDKETSCNNHKSQ